jgi:tetratricopeptide (TPR) repeat protein/SAM-dependent methyltransferase
MFSWFKHKSAAPTGQPVAAGSPEGVATQAVSSSGSAIYKGRGDQYFAEGNMTAAAASYKQALSINPSYAEVHANLGNVYREQAQHDSAERCYQQAILLKPEFAGGYYNLGALLQAQGRMEEAVVILEKACELKPDAEIIYRDLCYALFKLGRIEAAKKVIVKGIALNSNCAVFHLFLGNLHNHETEFDSAIACYRKALSIQRDYAEAHTNLGRIFQAQGLLAEAVRCFQNAIALEPTSPHLHCELGQVLQRLERLDEAIDEYQAALRISPDFGDAHFNLGTVLLVQDKWEAAALSFDETLRLVPGHADAYCNLGAALFALGRLREALVSYQHALQLEEKYQYKNGFFQCLAKVSFTVDIADMRLLVIRALTEPWGEPYLITGAVLSLIKLNPDINSCIERAAHAWPVRLSGQELFGHSGLVAVVGDTLLKCLLVNAHNSHLDMERFLTMCRSVMLANVMKEDDFLQQPMAAAQAADVLDFYCAFAQQCFIVEYVFDCGDEEYQQARQLWDELARALKSGSLVSTSRLIAVATYFPLFSLPHAETLLNLPWPEPMDSLLTQQIREPMEERRLRQDIPRLTAIENDVSLLVQQQYEENPYPRWVKFSIVERTVTVDDFLRKQFPLVPFRPLGKSDALDILIAGCGTGQHPIGTAQKFRGTRVLAVDLSLSSLSYAKRKARELRLENLEFAQADIMNLGVVNRKFDVIESVGVLHHLADPLSGWKILLSLLRPGGFMCLGFYSERARREVVAARNFIAGKGYVPRVESIRRCRQELMSEENIAQFRTLSLSPDFYGMSACRDLIFHVQEHRYTPSQLKENMAELEVDFLGFSLNAGITKLYSERFPDDESKTNLDYWDSFEAATPFTGMYEFWVQKRVSELMKGNTE